MKSRVNICIYCMCVAWRQLSPASKLTLLRQLIMSHSFATQLALIMHDNTACSRSLLFKINHDHLHYFIYFHIHWNRTIVPVHLNSDPLLKVVQGWVPQCDKVGVTNCLV